MPENRSKSDRLVALFLLGTILFNFPILSLFNRKSLALGVPLLYLFLFGVWAGLIAMIIFITTARTRSDIRDQ